MAKFLPALGLVIVVAVLFFSPVFNVRAVTVSQPANCLPEQKLQQSLKGTNIFFLDAKNIAKKIGETYGCQPEIAKKYPSTVEISLQAEKPVVKVEGTGLGLTPSGQFSKISDNTKPTIFLPPQINPKDNAKVDNPMVLSALKIASILEKSDFIPTNIRFTDQNSVAVYNQEFLALFSTQKDISVQVDSLQSILAKAKINASKIVKIDLRFDKPVIVYTSN